MSTSYDCYTGFVPVRFCNSDVVKLVSTLRDIGYSKAEMSDDGARFPVIDGGDCDTPAIAYYFGTRLPPKWCNELVRRLVKEGKISLDFSWHYNSGDGYDEEENPVDWESTLRDCPTLILREVLAQRLENLH